MGCPQDTQLTVHIGHDLIIPQLIRIKKIRALTVINVNNVGSKLFLQTANKTSY